MDYHSIFLFQGLTEADIDQMERGRCLRRKAFARRQTIFHTGDTVHEIGIVLRGAVHIESIDLWGSKSILSEVGEGQAFAETYAFCGEPLMVDVLAAADSEVLFLDTAALSRPHAEHSWQEPPAAESAPCLHEKEPRPSPAASSALPPRPCGGGC